MFSEFGFRGFELEIVRTTVAFTALGLFCVGGTIKQEEMVRRWKDTHAATMFKSNAEGRVSHFDITIRDNNIW